MVDPTSSTDILQQHAVVVSTETEEAKQLMYTSKWQESANCEPTDIPEKAMPLHPRAANPGGMYMPDEGGEGTKAFK